MEAAKYNKGSRVGPGAYDVHTREVIDASRKVTPRGYTFAKGRAHGGSSATRGGGGGANFNTPKNVLERRAAEAKRAQEAREEDQLARLDEMRKDDHLHPTTKKQQVLKNSPRFGFGSSSREQAGRVAAALGGSNGAAALSPRLAFSPRLAHPPLPTAMDAIRYNC